MAFTSAQLSYHPPLPQTEGVPQHADAHYISANCVVLTYFSGDLAAAVDEHFSRALTQSFSKTSKGGSFQEQTQPFSKTSKGGSSLGT